MPLLVIITLIAVVRGIRLRAPWWTLCALGFGAAVMLWGRGLPGDTRTVVMAGGAVVYLVGALYPMRVSRAADSISQR